MPGPSQRVPRGDTETRRAFQGISKTLETGVVLKTIFTTKGDIIAASAPSTPERLGVGADGAVLLGAAAASQGMKWYGGGADSEAFTRANLAAATAAITTNNQSLYVGTGGIGRDNPILTFAAGATGAVTSAGNLILDANRLQFYAATDYISSDAYGVMHLYAASIVYCETYFSVMPEDTATNGTPEYPSFDFYLTASIKPTTGGGAKNVVSVLRTTVDVTLDTSYDSAYLDIVPPNAAVPGTFTAEGVRIWHSDEGALDYLKLWHDATDAHVDAASGDLKLDVAGANVISVEAAVVTFAQALAMGANAISGVTTISMNNQLTNTLAIGTSPFVITSTTMSANLNADLLDGNHAAAFSVAAHLHDTQTLQHDAVNSDGGAFSFTTTGTVTFAKMLAVTSADACLLDLNPSATGTQTIIDITPSAAIATQAAEWEGISINGAALDPSQASVGIHAICIDLSGVSLTNTPHVDGIEITVPQQHHALHITEGNIFLDSTAGTTPASIYKAIQINPFVSALDASSEFHAIDVSVGSVTSGTVAALATGSFVDPIHQHVGTFATPSQTEYAARFPNGGAWADGIDGQNIFVANLDAIYIGAVAAFDALQVIMTTPATKSVEPKFYYYDTSLAWVQFVPVDGTEGFEQNGTITWNSAAFTNWKSDYDPGAADGSAGYYIKVTRNRVATPGTVTPTTVKLSASTSYYWDNAGAVSIANLYVPDGGTVGISGNELLTFNAAGNITVSGADLVLGQNAIQFWDAGVTIASHADGRLDFTADTSIDAHGTVNAYGDAYIAGTAVFSGISSHRIAGVIYAQWRSFADDGLHLELSETDGVGNHNLIICSRAWGYKNFDHNLLSTNPTLFIHSAINPDTANTQWISFTHDQTDGVIDVGTGVIKFADNAKMDSTNQLQFRDAAIYIASLDDGHLDLVADVSIDLNGAVVATSTVDAAGGFKDNGTPGVDGSFTAASGETVTVSGGIVTGIVAP